VYFAPQVRNTAFSRIDACFVIALPSTAVVRWLGPARERLERGVMYENNTSSDMGVMLRADACRPVWFDQGGRGNPGLQQPAAV
jgi:hypothetical protein